MAQHLPASFPALSVCVIHQSEIVWHDARGWIDPGDETLPVSFESLFDLASVTKLIVETSFLVLVDAGAIALESRLVDVIPEFGLVNPRMIGSGQDPHTRAFLPVEPASIAIQLIDPAGVTFKHLLTHSSGLPPWRSVYLLAGDRPPPPPTHVEHYDEGRWRRGLKAMVDFPFAGNIGDAVGYTDIGIMLLGEAVARLHGRRLNLGGQ